MPKTRLTKLLAQRQFVRFWLARLAGVTANQMLTVAVAWQMYDITSSAFDLGLVGLFQFVPALLMTLPTGHMADVGMRSLQAGLDFSFKPCCVAGFLFFSLEL